MSKHVLLASPSMQPLAKRICEGNDSISYCEISWGHFPDGFPDTFIENKETLMNANVSFLACFDTPATIFEQISVIYDLAEYSPKSFKVLLPYFPTGTMERKDHEGQIATASSLAHMLSAVAPSGPGPVPFYIWDIHALPIRHYFGQNIAPRFKTGTKLLKERLKGQKIAIGFPDEGAWKRFHSMFAGLPIIICSKVRDGETRIVKISEGDVKDKHVVIVDDLVHSGGTTIKCFDALMTAGAKKVSAFSTHGVMELEAWKKFLNVGFEKVWITDSCPKTAELVSGKGPFEVLSLKESITSAILD